VSRSRTAYFARRQQRAIVAPTVRFRSLAGAPPRSTSLRRTVTPVIACPETRLWISLAIVSTSGSSGISVGAGANVVPPLHPLKGDPSHQAQAPLPGLAQRVADPGNRQHPPSTGYESAVGVARGPRMEDDRGRVPPRRTVVQRDPDRQ